MNVLTSIEVSGSRYFFARYVPGQHCTHTKVRRPTKASVVRLHRLLGDSKPFTMYRKGWGNL